MKNNSETCTECAGWGVSHTVPYSEGDIKVHFLPDDNSSNWDSCEGSYDEEYCPVWKCPAVHSVKKEDERPCCEDHSPEDPS